MGLVGGARTICPVFTIQIFVITKAWIWKIGTLNHYTQLAQLHTQSAEQLRFCAKWNTHAKTIDKFIKNTMSPFETHTFQDSV